MSIWHVAEIAWGANLAFHGAFGDMTILRFARRSSYGWYSALGMFIGHFMAWLAAGVMGAGAAMILSQPLTGLDAGEVAFQALGPIGILAVIVAGWTTSNPTIYRAGLAFQSLNPGWSRERVTLVVGVVTTIIACFPFVFTGLLGFLGVMALVMAPTGGIIFAEHYLLKRLGMPRYWRTVSGARLNVPAALTWMIGVGVAAAFGYGLGVHILFLFVPAWITALVAYPLFCALFGAGQVNRSLLEATEAADAARKSVEASYLASPAAMGVNRNSLTTTLLAGAAVTLVWALVVGVIGFTSGDLGAFKTQIIYPTAAYFVLALILVFTAESHKA
jgi:NCS1 family nucleobase:cation symporter-1